MLKVRKCSICGMGTDFESIGKHDYYNIYRCPVCDVIFSHPMKNPGANWYRQSHGHIIGRILNNSVM